MNRFLNLHRLRAMLMKEFIQMRRDRLTFAMMLGIPLIQLLLFGYAINTNPKHLPAALVTAQQGPYERAIVAALEATGYYRFVAPGVSATEAEALLARGDISFVVTIPADFDRRVERGDNPTLLVEADATDPSAASGAISTLSRVAQEALTHEEGREAQAAAQAAAQVQVVVHERYNPEGITQYNIVPGFLGVILQMTMVIMTAAALTRETERGTMENLLAMPASPLEIMLGKVLPFFFIGAVQMAVILAAAKLLFHVPFVGSFTLLLTGVLIFVMALVLLGYTFSTFARTQMQAMQLSFFFFLPSIMLSGFMFPYRGMPIWAQDIGELLPLTHFIRLVRAVMLKGATVAEVQAPLAALVAFVLVYSALALTRFRRTLD